MKHQPSEPVSAERVADGLAEAGIAPTPAQCALLADHATAVLEANRQFNLTRIDSVEGLIRLHIVDSLLPWTRIEPLPRVVDLGSGAGFPGIPIAIVHGGPVTLCESVQKKARFLEAALADLGLEADVYAGRSEELAAERPGQAETVTARAVSSLAALVELAAPLLAVGGRLVALKGVPDDGEVAAGAEAARQCGMEQALRWDYVLPGGTERRCAIVYERTGEPVVRLPRRPGLAQKQPLSR